MIKLEIDQDRIAHVIWDNPDGPVNVKSAPAIAAFVSAVDRVIADPQVVGVLIRSAKRDFVAGGDVRELYAVATPAQAIDKVASVGECLRRMERSGKPFVAVINGSALGGGLELALACHRRVVADDDHIRLGLPEVTLGLIPGAGGTQRLPRLIGIAPATRLLLEGRSVGPREALALGLVDEVVAPQALLEAARRWILSAPEAIQPWDRKGFRYRDFEPQSLQGRMHFFHAWPALRRKSPPGDPAAATLLHVLGQALQRDIDAGLRIERRYFGSVVASRAAKNGMRNRFLAPAAARAVRGADGQHAELGRKAGVVGAGLMGSGIALVCARAGFETVLIDRDEATAAAGRERIAKALDGLVQRGQMGQGEREATLARITTGADDAVLQGCGVVVEAVVEVADTKHAVFERIAAVVGPDALIASNTSTLSISAMAQRVPSPERFIGLHFFAPVERMPLVEVIRGARTGDAALARALAFLGRLRKTPVVVSDGPGFYTSRVVAAYTREALIMLGEGVSPVLVDNAAVAAGFPIGPLAMADLTSYDLLADILGSLAREGRGTACQSDLALATIRTLCDAGRVGRKGRGGVYQYVPGGKTAWEGLSELFPPRADQPALEEVVRRLLHIQSLEAVHAIEDGIIADPMAMDMAAVLGWSYPVFRGGPLAHIDDTTVAAFVDQCERLARSAGSRYAVPRTLYGMAETATPFHRPI
jgi:3-hydroxyacyl-CoA dehydrogenase/enoyl-CoA hydratase/3-hydroxybutyryl-CoA epimerase